MITSVRMVNFKNFADETLKVGPFTVIVGANASGKSNIRDAFRFLHGIGRGYTLAEIMGGKYGPGGQLEWEGIRGAPNEVVSLRAEGSNVEGAFSTAVEVRLPEKRGTYWITSTFNPDTGGGFLPAEERLEDHRTHGVSAVYTVKRGDDGNSSSTLGVNPPRIPISNYIRPHLAQLSSLEQSWEGGQLAWGVNDALARMSFLELLPERMREPSVPGAARLGDSGENLPSVMEAICADAERGRTLMSWLQELTPMDVKDFDYPRDPSGRVHLHIVERNGRKVSAYSASDGTLRFLGILAALLSPNEGGLYFFEEIDNGIHPNRLWLLMDFIDRQTAKGNLQVITTTHSPALLSWMSDSTFENTSVVYRDQYWAGSVIRPIADLYNLRELRKSVTLGELHTEGWIEQAMKASEGNSDTDHLDKDEDDWEQGTLE